MVPDYFSNTFKQVRVGLHKCALFFLQVIDWVTVLVTSTQILAAVYQAWEAYSYAQHSQECHINSKHVFTVRIILM